MRKIFSLTLIFLSIQLWSQDPKPENLLKTHQDSIDYFFGVTLGFSLQTNSMLSSYPIMFEGMIAGLENLAQTDKTLSEEILKMLISTDSTEVNKDLLEGKKFLAKNGIREGVITTASGLQYEVIREGTGEKPSVSSIVEVNYEGKLLNGSIFDSSYDRGAPITFGLRRVVRGWTEALQLMPVGSEYILYLPPELGYGSRQSGPIPMYSTLIFKVELLRIIE